MCVGVVFLRILSKVGRSRRALIRGMEPFFIRVRAYLLIFKKKKNERHVSPSSGKEEREIQTTKVTLLNAD